MTRLLTFFLLASCATAALAAEVALVTGVAGNVVRALASGTRPVAVFAKLSYGDQIFLEGQAVVRLVYFDSGRQETWRGPGQVQVAKGESTGDGLGVPQVAMLPAFLVQQISRTPGEDGRGPDDAERLRGIGPETVAPALGADPDALKKIEANYRQLRLAAASNDLNPELYFLAALFELREYERVAQEIAEIQRTRSRSPEAGLVVALYQKALKNARARRAAPAVQ